MNTMEELKNNFNFVNFNNLFIDYNNNDNRDYYYNSLHLFTYISK